MMDLWTEMHMVEKKADKLEDRAAAKTEEKKAAMSGLK